ncbi:MAG: hypothetical protein O9264_10605 [Leptospira sp.]|nr:hypothetical protein [Leptospira sp.]
MKSLTTGFLFLILTTTSAFAAICPGKEKRSEFCPGKEKRSLSCPNDGK